MLKTPNFDNDGLFDLPNSTGLQKQWEQWKGQVGYSFKDEEFEQLQMKLGYGEFFTEDAEGAEMGSEEQKNAKWSVGIFHPKWYC